MKERNEKLNVIDFLNGEGFTATKETKENFLKQGFKSPHDGLFFNLKPESGKSVTAIIRFMPNIITEQKIKDKKVRHFSEVYQHKFRTDSGFMFVETCLSTIGKKCPICQLVNPLFNGNEIDQNKYFSMKRKRTTFMNILVLKNDSEPETEKKVFLFKPDRNLCGDKNNSGIIFSRIPEDKKLLGTKNPSNDCFYIDPFSPKHGTHFRLVGSLSEVSAYGKKMRFVEYSSSNFYDDIKPIDNDTFNKYYEMCQDLDLILEWDEYKVRCYDELEKLFKDNISGKGFDFPDNMPSKIKSIEEEVNNIVDNDKIDERAVDEELKNAAKDGLDIDVLTEEDIEIVEDESKTPLNDDDFDEFLK
jgi:hypothetical protein